MRRPEGREDTLVLRLLFAAVIAAMCAVPLWGLVFSPAPQGAGGSAPASVGVVTVNEGESLSDVARRVAPAVPIDVAVANIRELNGLQNSLVVPGQSLVAPVVPCTGDCSLGPWQ
ncbi:LysM peptidoglycan-binding domain-containing protein [Hoyosella sp. YIM 151337]|uniref:LysM peptidoglycan-binding domain-containing protein n=1 Tax=Hoyosella sp. YIM 151337 TaxID=2992742 RepID=UPI0022356197|nr:LysM peptidoglycan-binding domain-containing protein [Hoyosella sp. YIM 151337]MCW4353326.1 LysM peptidoglycan-binding domain-containing protein [Hoyosella sp. YIM 151337]